MRGAQVHGARVRSSTWRAVVCAAVRLVAVSCTGALDDEAAHVSDHVRRIQRAYPQLYLACQTRKNGVSERDSSLVAHLDELSPMTAGALAKHMGVCPSTITEAVDRLEIHGLCYRRRRERTVELRITQDGIAFGRRASSTLRASRG